jgi:hypothetical protein
MAKKNEETALTVANSTEVLAPQDFSAFEQDVELRQQVSSEDLQVPYLMIIQSNSPQLERGNAKYNPKARSGDFVCTIDNAIYSGEEGIHVLPCGYVKKIVAWVPRDEGGGWAGQYDPADPRIARILATAPRGEKPMMDGLVLVETMYFPMIAMLNGAPAQVMVSFTSTQLKKGRLLNSMTQNLMLPRSDGRGSYNPPAFTHFYKLTTGPEKNKKGNWMGWTIDRVGPVDLQDGTQAHAYALARGVAKLLIAGQINTQPAPDGGDDVIDANDDVAF